MAGIKPVTKIDGSYVVSPGVQNAVKRLGKISGAEQRLIMGIFALSTQPLIDYKNKNVDEQTRKFSVARTVVKIIVGTTVGTLVRLGTVAAARKLVFSGKLKPQKSEIAHSLTRLNDFAKTVGTFLGVLAVVVTNFALDMPLCKLGMDLVVKKFNLQPGEDKKT